MANGFSITISAIDRASGVMAVVNKHLAELQAPAKRFAQQVTKFTELSGLKKVNQGFQSLIHSTAGAARGVTRVAEPLAAITSAVSIGGFVALMSKWAEFNTSLEFAAQRMGVLPSYLGQIRAQANLAGASGESAQAGFETLGQTLYDVANGQSPQAAYVMSRLGIALTDASGHARKAQEVLPQLMAGLRSIRDPLVQARTATIFFGGATAEMLPIIRMTNAELEENRRRVLRYGGSTDAGAAAAVQFSQAQAAVSQSVIGLTDAIETQLAPVLSPLLLDLADWIAKGRTSQFVTHDLAEYVRDFGTWLKAIDFHKVLVDVEAFGDKVLRVLKGLEAWEGIVRKLLGLPPVDAPTMTVPAQVAASRPPGAAGPAGVTDAQGNIVPGPQAWGAAIPSPLMNFMFGWNPFASNPLASPASTSAEQTARAKQAMAILQGLGRSHAQAAGMAANMVAEGINPTGVGDNGQAYGIGQWHPDRQEDFRKWAGFDIRDQRATFEKQVQFFDYELRAGHDVQAREAGRLLNMTNSPSVSGAIISEMDMRPHDKLGQIDARGRLAQNLFDTTPDGAPGPSGRVDVNITHDGAGKVTAKSRGKVNPPRIASVMPNSGQSTLEAGDVY